MNILVNKTLSKNIIYVFRQIINIENYPAFIPFCKKVTFKPKSQKEPYIFNSLVTIGVGFLEKYFTSNVQCLFWGNDLECSIDIGNLARSVPLVAIDDNLFKEEVGRIEISIESQNESLKEMKAKWVLVQNSHSITSVTFEMDIDFHNSLYIRIFEKQITPIIEKVFAHFCNEIVR